MIGFEKQFIVDSPSGAKINTYCSAAKGETHAIVHISHGLAEHAVRYGEFSRALSKAGYQVYAHDHRGHGHTKADDAPLGIFSTHGGGIDKVMADCNAVQDFALRENPDLPVFMIGHSMGGLTTMNYLLRHGDRLAGAAVMNANFDAGALGRVAQMILKYERFRLGSDVPSRILPKLTFDAWAKQIKDRRTDFDWLSHINAEVDTYIADPLCGWDASVGLWQDVFSMIFGGGHVADAPKTAKSLPLLLIGGGEDPATDNGKAVTNHGVLLKKSGFSNVQCHVFSDARHETLNDNDADKLTDMLIDFIGQNSPSLNQTA